MRPRALSAVLSLVTLLTLGSASAYASGEVRVSMHDGRVSLSATDATLRDILNAWAIAGQTAIVNADGITSTTPLTLQLNDVREGDALAVLLRSLGGYLAIVRPTHPTNVSQFERIVLLPVSVANHDSTVFDAPAAAALPQPAPAAAPRRQAVIVNGVARLVGPDGALVEDDQQDAPPPRNPARADVPPPAQVQPQPASRQGTPPAITGSATPGVPVPAPPPASNAPRPTQR